MPILDINIVGVADSLLKREVYLNSNVYREKKLYQLLQFEFDMLYNALIV